MDSKARKTLTIVVFGWVIVSILFARMMPFGRKLLFYAISPILMSITRVDRFKAIFVLNIPHLIHTGRLLIMVKFGMMDNILNVYAPEFIIIRDLVGEQFMTAYFAFGLFGQIAVLIFMDYVMMRIASRLISKRFDVTGFLHAGRYIGGGI